MSFMKKNDSPSQPLFNDFKILNFKANLILNQAKFMWQISNNMTPKCISDMFGAKKNKNRPLRITTFSQNFIPVFRTTYKERFISNIGVQIWNEIPKKIIKTKNIKLFTKHLYEYLSK